MEGSIIALNVGQADFLSWQGKEISSAINKKPSQGPLYLSNLQFEGDVQADTVHHGGPDKAVCVYSHAHYPYWENGLGMSLVVPSFGENLTVEGLTEKEVCIGDIYRLGEALVQVSQPRQPCFKVAAKLNQPLMVKYIQDTSYSGYYLRVLKEGIVRPEDKLVIEKKHQGGITVEFVNRITYIDKENREGLTLLANLVELAEGWRSAMKKRLETLPGQNL
ncbi:MOSC domain-containing protein [Fictibacillus terranigra]|uniref:MOSC domain-containing protein n=1 Tax=Fictibacillus terranigra TaxID=3058424 RepID=A0ABT8E0Z1_9BACL|nr:MOSC domain-containing protein [Fictibacillus sp. CENA-BCM004]MDN4071566.1 MOSC domain-containing protein [Fictibacillus sp. CENA-BCM004]